MREATDDTAGRGPVPGEARERQDIARRGRPATDGAGVKRPPPETDEHPAPGIEHEPEPDAENIVPAKDRPGTL